MDEFLNEDFTMELSKALQKEFERFVAETGDCILAALQPAKAAGKTKAKGKLFITATAMPKKQTLAWQIAEEYLPLVWEAITADHTLANAENAQLNYNLFAEDTENGKLARFALRESYNGATTPTFVQFGFALSDYLKAENITLSLKAVRKPLDCVKITYAYKKP